jgi:6-pyruvoyltetrahydropterin/6-carboxytetrahydropterin synthase
MFETSVETVFAAAHAIVIGGVREPVHGHNWHVTATIAGRALDAEGLLCDFHLVERALNGLTERFRNQNLNDHPPFNRTLNPSAENLAFYIADELSKVLTGRLPPGVTVASVRVTEAPGCAATYRPMLP